MSTPNGTQTKGLKPVDLEDKALTPGEDKAVTAPKPDAAPAETEEVKVVIAHPVRKGVIGNDEPLEPGDAFTTNKDTARDLVTGGVARLA